MTDYRVEIPSLGRPPTENLSPGKQPLVPQNGIHLDLAAACASLDISCPPTPPILEAHKLTNYTLFLSLCGILAWLLSFTTRVLHNSASRKLGYFFLVWNYYHICEWINRSLQLGIFTAPAFLVAGILFEHAAGRLRVHHTTHTSYVKTYTGRIYWLRKEISKAKERVWHRHFRSELDLDLR
jgi:hypothetical protein